DALPDLVTGLSMATNAAIDGKIGWIDLSKSMYIYGAEARTARTATSDAAKEMYAAQAGMGDFRKGLDDVATSADTATTALQGFQKATQFTGDEGVKAIQNQKDAYDELTKMPEKRAAAEQTWNGIILSIAKTSSDTRVQNAQAALATEDANFKTAMAKRQTDQTTFNAWVKTEEERITQLRKDQRWTEAGEAEQALNHSKEGFATDLGSREELQKAHDDRVKELNATLWGTIKTSRDNDLVLATANKDSELGLLDDRKTALDEYVRTGKMWADDWRGSWATAMDKFKEGGIDKFDKFYDHVKKKLDQPMFFEVHAVYVPSPEAQAARQAAGKGYQEKQHGGMVEAPEGQAIPIIAHGGEVVINPREPDQGLAALMQAIAQGKFGHIWNLGPIYTSQNPGTIQGAVNTLRMLYPGAGA
ncbi:MAG: hypothetical protein KKA73_31465, partial [Chloroflexi bacterium]|nr:hypothetical protein [Chloroflexota bacterium]